MTPDQHSLLTQMVQRGLHGFAQDAENALAACKPEAEPAPEPIPEAPPQEAVDGH